MRLILNKYTKYDCGVPYLCAYCGLGADTTDHVVPVSYADSMAFNGIRLPKKKLITVPCCRECNSIAGSKVFASFSEKRDFIQKRIEGLYWDVLRYPDWEDEELEELAGSTLQDVKISILQKRVTLERISFSAEIFPVKEPSISEIAC